MSQKSFMRQCKACGKPTLHIQEKPNHVLHVLLSVFTLGIWLPIWLLIGLFGSGKPQCTVCGKEPGLFGIG